MTVLDVKFVFFSALLCTNGFVTNAFSVNQNNNANTIDRMIYSTEALSESDDPIRMLDTAYNKGVRSFDIGQTCGGMGESERLFGEWLASRDIDRSDICIITKGGTRMDRYKHPDQPLLDMESLEMELDVSLNTLNVDHVDLYMLHCDNNGLSIEKTVDWINVILESGKICKWGVSNWSFEKFKAAHKYANEKGHVPPSANSPQFSIAAPVCDVWPTMYSISQPHHETEIQWYADNGVQLLCWEGE